MKNNYLFLIIILVAGLVIVLGIVFVQKPKNISKEVDFLAPYQLIENFSCNLQGYNSNHGRICLNNITFNYVGKEYSLTSPNFYQTPNCIEAFGSSFCPGSYIWKDEIILSPILSRDHLKLRYFNKFSSSNSIHSSELFGSKK